MRKVELGGLECRRAKLLLARHGDVAPASARLVPDEVDVVDVELVDFKGCIGVDRQACSLYFERSVELVRDVVSVSAFEQNREVRLHLDVDIGLSARFVARRLVAALAGERVRSPEDQGHVAGALEHVAVLEDERLGLRTAPVVAVGVQAQRPLAVRVPRAAVADQEPVGSRFDLDFAVGAGDRLSVGIEDEHVDRLVADRDVVLDERDLFRVGGVDARVLAGLAGDEGEGERDEGHAVAHGVLLSGRPAARWCTGDIAQRARSDTLASVSLLCFKHSLF